MEHTRAVRTLLLAATALTGGLLLADSASAQDTGQLQSIEAQIKALQSELQSMKHDLAARESQVRAAQQQAAQAKQQAQQAQVQATQTQTQVQQVQQQAPALAAAAATTAANTVTSGPMGTFHIGGVTVTLGGFIEAAGIYRSRNEVADVGSSFSTGIPLPNSQLYHEGEIRGTARQSRLSLLVQGKPDDVTTLSAYYETDFLGAAPTANSVESNSYNLRMRLLNAQYDRSDLGLHILGGQAWSLLTMNRVGIVPRQENIPLTIDAQYVTGFNWTRNAQIRVAKDFDNQKYWLAISAESPQANVYAGPNGTGVTGSTVNFANPGGSLYSSGTNYSTDIAPDFIVKAAADPGFGHFEAYGLARFINDRVSVPGSGSNHTILAGGGGAGMLIPIIKNYVDLQGNVLAGEGIGRYGSAQLPDATIGANGAPVAIPEVEAMIGLVAHPSPKLDIYTYVGTEVEDRKYFKNAGRGFGYGSPLYANGGCDIELSTVCVGNTSSSTQGTIGFWYRFYKGSYGTFQSGAEYSYTKRSIFSGVGVTPSTDENIVMLSMRYYPFQ